MSERPVPGARDAGTRSQSRSGVLRPADIDETAATRPNVSCATQVAGPVEVPRHSHVPGGQPGHSGIGSYIQYVISGEQTGCGCSYTLESRGVTPRYIGPRSRRVDSARARARMALFATLYKKCAAGCASFVRPWPRAARRRRRARRAQPASRQPAHASDTATRHS